MVGVDQEPESVRCVRTPSLQVWSDLSEVGVAEIYAVVRDRSPDIEQMRKIGLWTLIAARLSTCLLVSRLVSTTRYR